MIAAGLSAPVDPRVTAMAAALAAQYGAASRTVLFYGSCLRTAELDGLMLDFYLIVSDYGAAYGKSWLATANRLVPPNVFPFEYKGLVAKYAVLSEADFRSLCGPDASTVSVWARFAQPSRLVWAADHAARSHAAEAIALAPTTLLALTPAQADSDPLDRWRRGFTLTYGAELRAERGGRPESIVDFDPEHYRRLGALIPDAQAPGLDRKWRALRRNGKWLTLVRLAKASLTFAGGIDYLAWKINRHAGTQIAIRPWQRRFPILGALTLLPRLLARGAVR
nr:hypothetical protein [Sphingobium boeckii]